MKLYDAYIKLLYLLQKFRLLSRCWETFRQVTTRLSTALMTRLSSTGSLTSLCLRYNCWFHFRALIFPIVQVKVYQLPAWLARRQFYNPIAYGRALSR